MAFLNLQLLTYELVRKDILKTGKRLQTIDIYISNMAIPVPCWVEPLSFYIDKEVPDSLDAKRFFKLISIFHQLLNVFFR